ncbi:hypothetical protein F1728_19005 [Gimesia benthica]|uniref:Uncharacterized protein n=1 Tax=Gimesia benthica TaxID=2608982 RepID=A0A6I6AJ15_9PLAN|nr:hypothetical protein [Gimesia benthica]QGQ24649.1 hypothetical protein F1728_19005 [Gimesia benthica]
MQIIITAEGQIRCIYAEVIDLATIGRMRISRGSFVEPNADGQWIVDLSPVLGPRLGPFPLRSVALQSEIDWLEQHWLSPSP